MHKKWTSGITCLLAIAVTGASVWAQQESEESPPTRRRFPLRFIQQRLQAVGADQVDEDDDAKDVDETAPAEADDQASYWIGARFAPLADFDELVRAQLNLKRALVAVKVVPDGPAQQAGLRKHDVLLRFAGEKVTEIDELVATINDRQDAKVEMVILRGGKEQRLQVTPAQRPEQLEEVIEFPEIEDLRLRADEIGKRTRERHGEGRGFMFKLETDDEDEDGVTILRIAPRGLFRGIIGGVLSLPKDVDIRIDKSGGQPARIRVKSDEGEWEATEGDLDELPEEVRGHVEAFWGAPGELNWRDDWGKKTQRILKDVGVQGINIDAIHDNVRGILNAVDGGESEDGKVEPEEGVDSLKSEVEKLRRELRELKKDLSEEVDT